MENTLNAIRYAFVIMAYVLYFDFKINSWIIRCRLFLSEDEIPMLNWYNNTYHKIVDDFKEEIKEIRSNTDRHQIGDIFDSYEKTVSMLKDLKCSLKEDISSGMYEYEKEEK